MSKVVFKEEKLFIDTYPEASSEDLPMFAENRVHQRTSGNPYPNKVVLEAQRDIREKREYTVLKLENEYLEVAILPDLGGKVWYAKDKTADYNFFYKNNVVKPALIGVLGSWTSGGLEFNWPFHHRASTFMPVDYAVEETEEGITVWLSEHDPINRMKGMVGVSLKNGECIFETKVKLDNTTSLRHSFLWWENAAVPVDENYRIFFPEDVNYVRFHYKRSVTTFPIANNDRFGAFNGIYYDGDTDISQHKNTRQATSYFSAESKYDYFGGYDFGKELGVVHIADHHISPGKKMFTWAYSQLAKTWENALTDDDGQYAELMAGCYSDNQPDLTWIMPNETKTFSQKWFPIHGKGTPDFANDNGAIFWKEDGLYVQSVRAVENAEVKVSKDGKVIAQSKISLPAYSIVKIAEGAIKAKGLEVVVSEGKKKIFEYAPFQILGGEIPEPRKELPYFKKVETAEELYLEGLHVEQYRSPEYSAKACYLEALERDPQYSPALAALAELSLRELKFEEALDYANKAEKSAARFNIRLESGRIYYLKGLSLLGLKKFDDGYNYLYKSSWCSDYLSPSMLHIALIDLRRGEYEKAAEHFEKSLQYSGKSVVAKAFAAYTQKLIGNEEKAVKLLEEAIGADKLNLYAHALLGLVKKDLSAFCALVKTDKTQVLMDICEYLLEAGLTEETVALVEGVSAKEKLGAMPTYLVGVLNGKKAKEELKEGIAFPSRSCEIEILEKVLAENPADDKAKYLLGCLFYGKGRYAEGVKLFEEIVAKKADYRSYRNLAAAYYSHFDDVAKAKEYMKLASQYAPVDEKQITFERAYLMAKTGDAPEEIAQFILSRNADRDDLVVELARAYNHSNRPDDALKVLLDRKFVACEGGEHYIADEYMYAHYLKGEAAYKAGNYEEALRWFTDAQTLPQSLGSGLWNEVKTVPYRYFAARCLIKLGKKAEAEEILRGFDKYFYDFFSDMYLNTLAYYAARAYELLGDRAKGEALIEKRLAQFEGSRDLEDMGNFGTTPFFISFIDKPATARRLHFAYPLYLFSSFLGDKARVEKYFADLNEETYGIYIKDFSAE